MSILRRMTSHLDDAVFAELWTNALADGTSIAGHPHLQACAECRVRFASFSKWMDDVRLDAVGEADAAMTGERLAAQQAQIFRRLEAAERPARVIAFPKVPAAQTRPSPVRQWIAAAAAAGLIAGLGLGQLMDLRHLASTPSTFPADRVAAAAPRGIGEHSAVIPIVAVSEEATLAELEEASTPQYEALRAYDTFTPRAADFLRPR